MSEEKLVPPTKYLIVLFLIQITVIGTGAAIGFPSFSKSFMENLYSYSRYEMGREGSISYIYSTSEAGYISADFGLDMKTKYNATHMVVYWYMGLKLRPGETIVDLIQNHQNAEKVELRVYPEEDPSKWAVIEDYNVSNYPIDVEYGEVGGLRYIRGFNGIRSDPGSLNQWMIYIWNPKIQSFEYVAVPPDKFYVYNLDSMVFLFDEFGAFPPDCCSGGLKWEYKEYAGPSK
ncbi:MAG: hypothetical protein ACUVQ5_06230 [Candidatus Methanomethylicaceae archaeon]